MNPDILFFLFSSLLVVCAFFVVFSTHTMFSLLSLVSCFFFTAFLLFFLECDFLALIFVIVYVGAVAVFILFAVMMLESKSANLSKSVLKYLPISLLFGIFLLISFSLEISKYFNINLFFNSFYLIKWYNLYDFIDSQADINVYGSILYSYYVVHFLIGGFILLIVLTSVVYLTNIFNSKETLEQSEFKQIARQTRFFFKN